MLLHKIMKFHKRITFNYYIELPLLFPLQERLRIVWNIGEKVRDELNLKVILTRIPIFKIVDSRGRNYHVSSLGRDQLILRCEYPLDFLAFIDFFLTILKNIDKSKPKVYTHGPFELTLIRKAHVKMRIAIGFPNINRKPKLHLKVYAGTHEEPLITKINDIFRNIQSKILTFALRSIPWPSKVYELKAKERKFLLKASEVAPLDQIYNVFKTVNPRPNEFILLAGEDIYEYGKDPRKVALEALADIESKFIARKTKIKINKLKKLIKTLGNAEDPIKAIENMKWNNLRAILKELNDFYIRHGVRNNPITKFMPRRLIEFKLWERDYEDVFMGDYSGTCIALKNRGLSEMPKYLMDEYTEFFRILVNKKRIGHVKMFKCIDEDGLEVLHIDYIGISGGKYTELHEELKKYALSAAIELARREGLARVYVAKEIIGKLSAPLVNNRLRKKGINVYSQYLDAPKYLIWEAKIGKVVPGAGFEPATTRFLPG